MNDRHELIKQKYQELNFSYAETSRFFGISRQRVHQIVKGYRSFATAHAHSTYVYKGNKRWGLKSKVWFDNCRVCYKNKTIAVHHIDGNSRNNNIDNLVSVCLKCHHSFHKGSPHQSRKRYPQDGHTILVGSYFRAYLELYLERVL